MKTVILGDAAISANIFKEAWEKHLADFGSDLVMGEFEEDWDNLQYRRLEVEQKGPEIEEVDELIIQEGSDGEVLLGTFVPISSKVMDAMPNLKIIGVARAGLENINVEEATKRGILVFNVMGRNAHAVAEFTVGLMIAESRNIARAHYSIKNGDWQKVFSNSAFIPEMRKKTIGLVGFGYIGKLVAKKLSGFENEIIVYNPNRPASEIEKYNAKKVDLKKLMSESDFVSIHARLTEGNKEMIGKEEIEMMKPTSYLINTGRAGLVDQDALIHALKEKKIMGAALDVFTTEPIGSDSPFLELDNVTLTTHIGGISYHALNNSPYMLAENIGKLLKGKNKLQNIVNPEVLENKEFNTWLKNQQT